MSIANWGGGSIFQTHLVAFCISVLQAGSSQNVNSQNHDQLPKISTPKNLYFDKMHCICYFITCQTASQPDQYQAHFTVCGTWNDVMQDLEEMDSLDDFKTYFDS